MPVRDLGDRPNEGATQELDDGEGFPAGRRGNDEARIHPFIGPPGGHGGASAGVSVGDRRRSGTPWGEGPPPPAIAGN